eukprot:1405893-Ditylum_brightwellii.AAC.2
MLDEAELLAALKLYWQDMGGRLPGRMIANRDFKLISGNIVKFLSGVLRDEDEGDEDQTFIS